MSELEDNYRVKYLEEFQADVEEHGGSRKRYDQEKMKKEVGKEWEGYKTKIHRRPAAGESRDNEKQRVATEVSLRPSVVGKYPEGADPVPCNRPECLRKDSK